MALPNHDGRAGCAAVIFSSTPPELSELVAHLRQSLPSYAIPLFLRLTADLRLTGNMKHQKAAFKYEGVDPGQVGDKIMWLQGETYLNFTKAEWEGLRNEEIRL